MFLGLCSHCLYSSNTEVRDQKPESWLPKVTEFEEELYLEPWSLNIPRTTFFFFTLSACPSTRKVEDWELQNLMNVL